MTDISLEKALTAVYASLHNDNCELDASIQALKNAMQAEGKTSVEVMPSKLPQPNRQGRKLMQSYFKKRGVAVTFVEAGAK